MKLDINLNIKPELRQKLAITPLLRQSLEILSLSLVELDQMVLKEMEQNPLLKDSSTEYSSEGKTAEDSEYQPEQPEYETYEEPAENLLEKYEINEEAWANLFNELPKSSGSALFMKEKPSIEQINAIKTTLKEQLEWQLRLNINNDDDYVIGINIIGNLDRNGFISREELSNISDELKFSMDQIERVREIIKGFDPVGIASVDIPECLLAQLKVCNTYHPDIEKLLNVHFDDLKNGEWDNIIKDKELGLSAEDLKYILEILSKLDPKPGGHFDDREDDNIAIVPDIIIKYDSGDYRIELNEHIRPMLYIPENYRKVLLNKNPEMQEDREFLKKRLARAQWFIRSIDQRRQTLIKVGESFIKFQRDFLDRGHKYLKPMILKDIADDCEIHQSTVQRIVNQKYIDTPRGVFLMKYFFSKAIPKKNGDPVSSLSVKREMADLVKNESKDSPLSDKEIHQILGKKGIKISRRAVSKYRLELGIPNSNKRKKQIL